MQVAIWETEPRWSDTEVSLFVITGRSGCMWHSWGRWQAELFLVQILVLRWQDANLMAFRRALSAFWNSGSAYASVSFCTSLSSPQLYLSPLSFLSPSLSHLGIKPPICTQFNYRHVRQRHQRVMNSWTFKLIPVHEEPEISLRLSILSPKYLEIESGSGVIPHSPNVFIMLKEKRGENAKGFWKGHSLTLSNLVFFYSKHVINHMSEKPDLAMHSRDHH